MTGQKIGKVKSNMILLMIGTAFLTLESVKACSTTGGDKNTIVGHTIGSAMSESCPHITYAHGLLMNSRGIDCKYSINGNVFTTRSMATRIPLHGLLRYDCGDCSGHMILRGACSDCDDCVTIGNEHVCLNPSPAFYWGLGTGLITSFIIGIGIYLIIRFVERRSKHADTFNNLIRKKDKNSDDETDSDNGSINMHACPPSLVYGFCIMFLISPMDALYITSQNTHCGNNNCVDFVTVSFNLEQGVPRYLTLEDGGNVEVGVAKLEHVDYYRKIYDTYDYDLKVETTYNCKGAGECWYNGDCKSYERPKHFTWNNSVISDGGCYEVATRCDTFCFYSRACVYYKWELQQIGPMKSVYRFDFRSWKASVYIKKDNSTTYVEGSSMQDSFDWNEVDYKYPIEMAIKSGNVRSPEEYVMQIDGKYVNVNASPLGKPTSGMIGDYQVSDGNTYDVFSVKCETTSCKVACRHPTPAVRRVNTMNPLDCEIKENRLICKKTSNDEVLIRMGVDGIHNEVSYPSDCSINIETTWSCKNCPYPSNFVVRPYNVIKKGHIKIESNCTLNPPYLLCSSHPYSVEVIGDNKYCLISSKALNMSRVIHIKTIDDGKLEPDYGVIDYGVQSWTQWSSIITTPSYILGFQQMLNYGLIAMTFTLAIRYGVAFYIINKAGKVQTS
nr:MAG: glycoprotein precursor [Xinjiang sediment orthophasma-like virus]